MDNIEATSAIRSMQSGEKFTPNGVDLSQKENELILIQESNTHVGNTESIKVFLTEKCPEYYKSRRKKIDKYLKTTPAGAIEIFDEDGKSHFETFVNTDMVNDAALIPILIRHEAVEVVVSDKYLNTGTVARQIGIEKETIESDMYNDPAHYVAMYHELLLARAMGVLDKDLEFRHKGGDKKSSDKCILIFKPILKHLIPPKLKQKIESRAAEKLKSRYHIPKTIADKIKSDV